jgi:hypothetical protein
MSSIGLSQLAAGTGARISWISKSPLGGRTTPADAVRLSVGDVTAPQNRDAKTDRAGVGAHPAFSPPPKINPFPRTVIFPLAPTRASRSSMTQICPGGGTPRMILRFTATGFGPVPGMLQGLVAGQFTKAETGLTPMPPLKRRAASSAGAAAENSNTPTNGPPHIPSRNRTRFLLFISPIHTVCVLNCARGNLLAVTFYNLNLALL